MWSLMIVIDVYIYLLKFRELIFNKKSSFHMILRKTKLTN